jgi:hypothetical protein
VKIVVSRMWSAILRQGYNATRSRGSQMAGLYTSCGFGAAYSIPASTAVMTRPQEEEEPLAMDAAERYSGYMPQAKSL